MSIEPLREGHVRLDAVDGRGVQSVAGGGRDVSRVDLLCDEHDERLFIGYRWYESRHLPVRFPFGHGLSYTTFESTFIQAVYYPGESQIQMLYFEETV